MKKAKFTKQLTIMLHPAVYEQIRCITDQKDLSIGEWVREAIAAALVKNSEKSPDNKIKQKG